MSAPPVPIDNVSILIQPSMAESYGWDLCNIFYRLSPWGIERERKLNNSGPWDMQRIIDIYCFTSRMSCCQKAQDFWQGFWPFVNLGCMYTKMHTHTDQHSHSQIIKVLNHVRTVTVACLHNSRPIRYWRINKWTPQQCIRQRAAAKKRCMVWKQQYWIGLNWHYQFVQLLCQHFIKNMLGSDTTHRLAEPSESESFILFVIFCVLLPPSPQQCNKRNDKDICIPNI